MTGPAKRLVDLRPEFARLYRDHELMPDRGGLPTKDHSLSFTCPTCGPPNRVTIRIGPEPPDKTVLRWQAKPGPDEDPNWLASVTITPSINNIVSGHGPKHPKCAFHGAITKGLVVL